ncbi:hypothetical protein HK097_011152, partial [Rhizophlyctis rosea]
MSQATPNVPTITLSNGQSIPSIAFGTGTAWYKKNGHDSPLDEKLIKAIEEALNAGFTHIDTAETYGTEPEVGRAISNHLSSNPSISRSSLFITTKLLPSISDPVAALKTSLSRLSLQYVDLYLIHSPFFDRQKTSLATAWRALEGLVDQGLTKAIGVSNFRKQDLEELYAIEGGLKHHPVVNQVEFHPYLLDAAVTKDLIPYHAEKQIHIESYSPLLSLTHAKGGPLDAVVAEIAKAKGKTEGQILLKWNLQKGNVAVTSTSKPERLREFLAVEG